MDRSYDFISGNKGYKIAKTTMHDFIKDTKWGIANLTCTSIFILAQCMLFPLKIVSSPDSSLRISTATKASFKCQ